MQNHSYENDFDLHENETACRTHFHVKGFALFFVSTRFETEAQENSEMAYLCTLALWLVLHIFDQLKSPKTGETAVHCCDPTLSVLVMFVLKRVTLEAWELGKY